MGSSLDYVRYSHIGVHSTFTGQLSHPLTLCSEYGHVHLMDLLIVGFNHRTAPVALREKVAFSGEQLAHVLPALKEAGGYRELAILSTCNRTEMIAVGDSLDPALILSWLSDYHGLPLPQLQDSTYMHRGFEAVHHAMSVACGLDSMVVGEPQILGQFKDCFTIAQMHKTLGPDLNSLAQTTNRVAKRVRTDTGIGENSVSFASTSVTLAEQLFTDVASCQALLIGAGEMIRLVATHLRSAGVSDLVIANRTYANAEVLAEELGGQAIELAAIPHKLENTDIVISSTGSPLPILGKGSVERALKARRHKPIFMVDLAVPRDIEAEVSGLRDVYLYSIDDLQDIIEENLNLRQHAAEDALRIVEQAVVEFTDNYRSRDAVDTLLKFRRRHEHLKQQELEKAMARLHKGDDPAAVMSSLATKLTNKIIHVPSIEIKNAGTLGRQDLLDAVEHLFKLNDDA
jgi:glutamyl-tRNA reductase